jgi:hypothetical protein
MEIAQMAAPRACRRKQYSSMFLIRFSFPGYKKGTGKRLIVGGVDRGLRGETRFPFFPLPFRGPDASICYPARGMGWYMRDDVLAALEWIKTFCPNDKRLKFEIVRALEFVPANDAMPFAFFGLFRQARGNQDGTE